jgi:hypothetical protein
MSAGAVLIAKTRELSTAGERFVPAIVRSPMKNEKLQICVFCLCHFLYICGGAGTFAAADRTILWLVVFNTYEPRIALSRASWPRRPTGGNNCPAESGARITAPFQKELDDLANELASDHSDFLRSEILEARELVTR